MVFLLQNDIYYMQATHSSMRMKIEIRKRGGAIAALDEKGNPLMVVEGEVRNYGRGNQVYLPKEWQGRKVIVVDVGEVA